jgi:alcohol dehydrogenase, propanol-preferring
LPPTPPLTIVINRGAIMRALQLHRIEPFSPDGWKPLHPAVLPDPRPGAGEIVVQVSACGVCHTELDEIEGRTPPPRFPVVPGHQVVGRVVDRGPGAARFEVGARVGVGWIHSACGVCPLCRSGRENLCSAFRATGRDVDGGYAELMRVPEAFASLVPDGLSDLQAAPLLCAGAIGYRSLRLCGLGEGQRLGLMGFGASAHLVLPMALHLHPGCRVFAFSRSEGERAFARELGAAWSGGIEERPPEALDAIIDTTPAWAPVLAALRHLEPGGRLVINAIRKEDRDRATLASLDYPTHLWLEKEVKSVANVTRADLEATLRLAAAIPLRPEVTAFRLEDATRALTELKERKIRGAKVLDLARP